MPRLPPFPASSAHRRGPRVALRRAGVTLIEPMRALGISGVVAALAPPFTPAPSAVPSDKGSLRQRCVNPRGAVALVAGGSTCP